MIQFFLFYFQYLLYLENHDYLFLDIIYAKLNHLFGLRSILSFQYLTLGCSSQQHEYTWLHFNV